MATSRQWISMKNLALFALLTALSCCDPAPPFDEGLPGHARHRQGQALPSGSNPPRQRTPRLPAPYKFVPPRIARRKGMLPFDPENPRQHFPGFPEPPRGHGGKDRVPTPPIRILKWSRTHDKLYLGRLDNAPAPKLPKPPKYSQARHPRVQKAQFLGEQPLATFATATA
ncbi:uncharacterized protein LOC119159967 isoform X2 [Rhipicephalus microplus]|uniref:uncharacterized protein LOC119159967 isoform X2 n=1 Tax=Rhipicephalus microplus TaxID=6941 RepID=UPI003F6C4A46